MLVLVGLLLCGACGRSRKAQEPVPGAPISVTVSSAAFADGAAIPPQYSCDGSGARPPIAWGEVPAATKSIAIVVDDPDAPSGTFVHWTAWGFDPSAHAATGAVHEGAHSGGGRGWTPPCPPKGAAAHHYRFFVYALRHRLPVNDGASPDSVRAAIAAAAPLARGELTATYQRAR